MLTTEDFLYLGFDPAQVGGDRTVIFHFAQEEELKKSKIDNLKQQAEDVEFEEV